MGYLIFKKEGKTIMYSQYSNQPVSDPEYMTLLGTALYVFNANNAFIIENMLNVSNHRDWWHLIDQESGNIDSMIQSRHYSSAFNEHNEILSLFHDLVLRRNRIIHSFPVTSYEESDDPDGQILRTKEKVEAGNNQFTIDKDFLLKFIKDNDKLSRLLNDLRNHLSE